MRISLPRLLLALVLVIIWASFAVADAEIVARTPSSLTVRLPASDATPLYRVTYEDRSHVFVWENLQPDADGLVRLTDDRHLRPEFRLQCESSTGVSDPVVFDDRLKGPIAAKTRAQCGVPVSTFGGAGYLVPEVADLKRDDCGNFWLYLEHEPHALLKYGSDFTYQFALLLPDAPVAHDLDGWGDLWILHEGNWISKHSPLGETLGAWELPEGRDPGEVVEASGMVIDRVAGYIYLSDRILSRVQRFDLNLKLCPLPVTPWGWLGRQDLAYTRVGRYDEQTTYYQLDRPSQLLLTPTGELLVSCEHWITQFDLATGRQMPFGRQPVLGWGGSFSDSPFTSSAGLDGHWQRHWLAGMDAAGNVYVSDRENEFAIDPRLQVFSPEGLLLKSFDLNHDLAAASGEPVYITSVKGLAVGEGALWLVEAAGRVYESPSDHGLIGGGKLFLGPGAAGRQFDLSKADASRFAVATQDTRSLHRSEGRVWGATEGRSGSRNVETDGSRVVRDGEWSLWTPSRMGEPFKVELFTADGDAIPASDYRVEFEEEPGLFGTQWDFFRLMNRSGAEWREVRFVAEALQ
ncbi:MAG: hypothetical protein JXA57_08990 [Armatimonadetes bacterium]|nr:hypothetical protein [Armatimonadota bacterium]